MIRLVPMNETDFQAYLAFAIPDYAQEHVQSGRWSAEEALEQAQKQYQQLLPDGLQSKQQYFYSLQDEQQASKVGMLWFALEERGKAPIVFVYDVMIYEQFRRRGYGEQAFRAIESIARELGATNITLHVFGHNIAARAMYEKLGYAPTNIVMTKPLHVPSQ